MSEPNRFLCARITSSSAYLFHYYQLSFFGPGIEALTLSLRASLFAMLPNMSCFKQKFYFLFKSSSSEFNLDFESCLLSLSLCDTEAPHFLTRKLIGLIWTLLMKNTSSFFSFSFFSLSLNQGSSLLAVRVT